MKSLILPFFLLCSCLLKSETVLAVWDKTCCEVQYFPGIENRVKINFKFFEYELIYGEENQFIKCFEAQFSTDHGKNYTHLMSASTEYQASRTWAWIILKHKLAGTKIDITLRPHNQPPKYSRIDWKDGKRHRLEVSNGPLRDTQTWIGVNWFLRGTQYNITNVRIIATWFNPVLMVPDDNVVLDYDFTQKKTRLNSKSLNFSNSFSKQEIKTEEKIKTVKAYKKANTIVVRGAFSEKIQVYTASGNLVKSIVAENDIVKIELSVKQAYILSIGQIIYKVALCVP